VATVLRRRGTGGGRRNAVVRGVPRPAIRTDLAYVCARIRARFPRLLTPAELETLRGMHSLAELVLRLFDTDCARELRETVFDVHDLDECERD